MRTLNQIFKHITGTLPHNQIDELYIIFLKYPVLFRAFERIEKLYSFVSVKRTEENREANR